MSNSGSRGTSCSYADIYTAIAGGGLGTPIFRYLVSLHRHNRISRLQTYDDLLMRCVLDGEQISLPVIGGEPISFNEEMR